jgi:hypothetical protein
MEDVVEEAVESPYESKVRASFSPDAIQDSKVIEDTIAQLKQLIQQTQQGELERINKEFFVSNYEERYRISFKDVCA